MKDYIGTIIKESLVDEKLPNGIEIISTEIEDVTDEHYTPWLKQWTIYTVKVPVGIAGEIADELSELLDEEHKNSWYIDFKNDERHFIVFYNKVFNIERKNEEQYNASYIYGKLIGIPEHQLIKHID